MIFDGENFPRLPETWSTVTVEDACENVSIAAKIPAKDYLSEGALAVIDQGEKLVGGYSDNANMAVETQFPVIIFGDHTRAIKYIDFPFAAGADGIKVLRASPVFEPRLLYRLLQSVRLPNKGYARHFQHLRSSQIPLPPHPEQKRIADKLDNVLVRVDACRDRLNRIPALLKRFRQSVLAAATSGRLTEEWRAACCPDPTQDRLATASIVGASLFASDLPELPEGWQWSCPEMLKASDRYSLAIGPFGSNLKVSDYKTDGVPLVFVREIRANLFGGPQTKFVTNEKAAELVAHTISAGDLLITKMGDPPGDTAIYPQNAPDAVITADCIKLRVDSALALSPFVQVMLESPQSRLRLQEITGGVAQQKISLERFRHFPIPLAPMEEQHEIVRRVETLFAFADRLEARTNAARKQVEQLTPALLAKAFRGELVPQDPNDEPAAELLKRLAASRAEAPKARRGRKAASCGV